MSLYDKFLFPRPQSIFSLAISTNGGLSEINGANVQYSKFRDATGSRQIKESKFSTRICMLTMYTPSFVASIASFFWLFPSHDNRFTLVNSALTLHFLKRIFEIQREKMALNITIMISLSYCISTMTIIYNQHLLGSVPDPQIDLKFIGVVVFLMGIVGKFYHHYILSKLRENNPQIDLKFIGVVVFLMGIVGKFYHHYILSKLRENSDTGYKIPKGGLFGRVIYPHYLFEILAFVGISVISQSLYPILYAIGTGFYLTGRSYATRKWYNSKFPSFPKNVKCLVPFVF
ncbi:hypothetical protein MKX03_012529 [Papaver bracteatum]|nr:hypothetical protein MKX03_012529 [Papaver bracteatum]